MVVLKGLQWRFQSVVDFPMHASLIFGGTLLAVITFISQWQKPAPYGRHDPKDGKWGPMVNQRIGHILNDGLWGVIFFSYVYFTSCKRVELINLVFVSAWLIHFVHKGFIHPLVMRYSCPTVPLGIPVTGLTLAYYSFIHAKYFGTVTYEVAAYTYDLRFLMGMTVFIIGFVINRWSDWKLRSLRSKSGIQKYRVPHGGLFELVSCPNYLGEIIQWAGWALATWSPIGFVYFCFCSSTFIPRARHNHQWYIKYFDKYPRNRKALIPFLF